MTIVQVVGYCMTAFGLGYAGGFVIRLGRKAVESIE